MMTLKFNKKDLTADVVLGMNWIYWNKYFVIPTIACLSNCFLWVRAYYELFSLLEIYMFKFRQITLKSIFLQCHRAKPEHSHKKWKDSLEIRAVLQNFHNKLEFLRVIFNYMQGFSKTWRWRTRRTCIRMTLMLF